MRLFGKQFAPKTKIITFLTSIYNFVVISCVLFTYLIHIHIDTPAYSLTYFNTTNPCFLFVPSSICSYNGDIPFFYHILREKRSSLKLSWRRKQITLWYLSLHIFSFILIHFERVYRERLKLKNVRKHGHDGSHDAHDGVDRIEVANNSVFPSVDCCLVGC